MQTFRNIMLVGFGGFAGSILRYLMSGLVGHIFKTNPFPLGTAVVNITGCFVIGLLGGLAEHLQAFSPYARLFLFLGLLGGFATFSTFSYETVALLRDRELFIAFGNVGVHLLLGLAAVWLGLSCSKLLWGQA